MPDSPRSPAKSAVARARVRDERGHFIRHDEHGKSQKTNSFWFLAKPFKNLSITARQKQFPFYLLIALLILFANGIGTNKNACQTSTQTRIGVIYILKALSDPISPFERVQQEVATAVPFLQQFTVQTSMQRMILIERDNSTLSIVTKNNEDLTSYHTRQVFVTGEVNECRRSIEVSDADNVQLLP